MKKLEVTRDDLKEFGARVRALRIALNMTQKDFADSLHMSGSYLSERFYATGKANF